MYHFARYIYIDLNGSIRYDGFIKEIKPQIIMEDNNWVNHT